MRRNPVPPLIFLAIVAAVGLGWWFYAKTEAGSQARVGRVARSFSDIKLGLTISHSKGAISQEDYRMEDRNGESSSLYRAAGRNGTVITIADKPHQTTDVSFLFDKAVADGIWELPSRPARGDTATQYAVNIYQLTNGQHGSHEFTFTDPKYWATTGGHQYTIHLDKHKPVPDLLQMSSTTLIEPRYGALVDDFTTFGSAEFQKRIAAAKARLAGTRS